MARVVDEYELGGGVRVAVLSSGEYRVAVPRPSGRAVSVLRSLPFYLDPSDLVDEGRLSDLVSGLARRLSLSEPDAEWLRAKLSGYGPLYPLMADPKVTDIRVLPGRPVLVRHQEYGDLLVAVNGEPLVLSEAEVRGLALRLASKAGAALNARRPAIGGARLPSGDRLTASLGVVGEPQVVVRKFPRHPWTLHKLVARGMLSARAAALLWLLNEAKVPILIYGPMGSGKTSLAGAVIATARPRASIVIIQDIPEIRVAHPYAHYLYPAPTLEYSRLLSFALRTSSDYLVVGEVRGEEEARAFVQAVKTGHGGVTTMHADSVEGALSRLRNYGLSPADLASVRAFVRTGAFEARVRGLRTLARRVLAVDLLEGWDGSPSLLRVVEYCEEGGSWVERVEDPRVLDLLGLREGVALAKLRVREAWLSLLAERYAEGGLVETAEEWYACLEAFYSEEDRLLGLVDEPDRLTVSLLQLAARLPSQR